MTAAIFIRGHLMHEYGVDLSKVHWVQGSINAPGSHGSPAVLPLLKPVSIENNTSDKSLSDLLSEGKIDALIGTGEPHSMRTNPDVQRLFPDYREVEKEFYRRTRIFPIMHLIALRRDVYEKTSLRRDQPLQRVLPSQGHCTPADALSRHLALHAAVDDGGSR